MRLHKLPWRISLAGLVVVVGLPLVGHWARGHRQPGCSLDGTTINPAYRVEVVDSEDRRHAFCCLRCAQIWLDRQPKPPRSITVTDETSGQELDPTAAYYVRSAVVTTPTTGNRIHVFRNRADADRHAAACSGTVLSAAERPFR